MNTEQKIRTIVHRISKQEVTLGRDESLFDSGILDSFALVDVVSELEREFSVKIPDSDLNPRKFSSISSIEGYLQDLK